MNPGWQSYDSLTSAVYMYTGERENNLRKEGREMESKSNPRENFTI